MRASGAGLLCALSLAAFSSHMPAQTQPWIRLPTENLAVFEGKPEKFFMHVEREFEGEKTTPWEGGQYGFTRNPRRSGKGLVFTKLHEGIDIRPVRRDGTGAPLDAVLAAADGVAVHVSDDPAASNYGRYIVLRHDLGGCPYFSLYAHLLSTGARSGQRVRRGEPIGRMGYTGSGISKERAHVHFEFCLLLNRNFDAWFAHYIRVPPNRHGIFNGINLAGLDPLALIKAVRANPAATVPEFVRSQPALFRLVVRDSPHFDLLNLYPWLVPAGQPATSSAWAISFSNTLVPVKIEARRAVGREPYVEWAGSSIPSLSIQSNNLVSGSPSTPQLTESGARFAHLLTFPDP